MALEGTGNHCPRVWWLGQGSMGRLLPAALDDSHGGASNR